MESGDSRPFFVTKPELKLQTIGCPKIKLALGKHLEIATHGFQLCNQPLFLDTGVLPVQLNFCSEDRKYRNLLVKKFLTKVFLFCLLVKRI